MVPRVIALRKIQLPLLNAFGTVAEGSDQALLDGTENVLDGARPPVENSAVELIVSTFLVQPQRLVLYHLAALETAVSTKNPAVSPLRGSQGCGHMLSW